MVVLFACNKEKVINENLNKSDLITLQEFEDIGKEHNKALDKVLTGLKEGAVSYKKNRDNIEKIINHELNKFYEDNIDDEDLDCAIKQSEKEVSKFINRANDNAFKSDDSQTPLQSVIEEYSANLSKTQCKFLIEIDNAISQSGDNAEVIISKLNSIQEKALEELSVEESQVVLAGTEVGKASIQYWSENIEEWKEVLGEGGKTNKSSFSWSELGGSDVAGAVGGATYAVVINLIPGAGQAAYGGTIIATAAGASATDAVMQLWNLYF